MSTCIFGRTNQNTIYVWKQSEMVIEKTNLHMINYKIKNNLNTVSNFY